MVLQLSCKENIHLNLFYSDGFFHTYKYLKDGIVLIYIKVSQIEISKQLCTIIPDNCIFILENCAGPDEMPHFAAFHLGLHCLQEYPFRGFQCTKG